MNREELAERTMTFAVRVVKMAEALPKSLGAQTIAKQVVRSGFSVAANYRAANRGKSRPDFLNKITIVLEEADETLFWIEAAIRLKLLTEEKISPLRQEASELVHIFSAIRRTTRTPKDTPTNHQS